MHARLVDGPRDSAPRVPRCLRGRGPGAAPVLIAIALALGLPLDASGQYPVPRVRDSLETPFRLFDAGQWQEAFDAFEAVARETPGPLPPEALKRWGIAAAEAGRPLAGYIRLRQYLLKRPERTADSDGVGERVKRLREVLLAEALKFSRIQMSVERRPDEASPGERHIVRVAMRDGDVSLEGLSGLSNNALVWRRAEEIPMAPYIGLVGRLLDAPAVIDDLPAQTFDPNAPGPRHAVVLRLVIGEEERRLEALSGEPYERLKQTAVTVLDFARAVPAMPEVEAKAPPPPPPPPKPPKKRK